MRTCMPQATDDKERATKRVNGMKVAVSGMLTRANNLIENATVGTFPSIQTIKEPIVWRTVQQQRLEEALSAGQWRPLFDAADTVFNLEQQDQKRIDFNVLLLDDDLFQ